MAVFFALAIVRCYISLCRRVVYVGFFFFQAEDGIRDLVRSRGLGDVYKRQGAFDRHHLLDAEQETWKRVFELIMQERYSTLSDSCLLYTSDAADERSSVDLGGRRIIKKKNRRVNGGLTMHT